jgi:uncharacterized membrane protein
MSVTSSESINYQPSTIDDQPSAQNGANVGDTERWVSAISGGVLALYGLTRRTPAGIALAAVGGELLYRGATGRCHVYQAIGVNTAGPGHYGIKVDAATTINRSPEELYRFWRVFENLPRFMKHLESVTRMDDRRSHWVARAPGGKTVEWDAEITDERENQLIAWRSQEGSQVDNVGSVRFDRAPGGRGTIVRVSLQYNPPGGIVGATLAKLFGEEPQQQISEDLRRFKQMMEAGEVPTTEGQPSGRRQS